MKIAVIFDQNNRKIHIREILIKNQIYKIASQGFHHTYKQGTTTFHVFTACTETMNFKLTLNSETLFWKLDEIYDSTFA